jgi:putative membrane protein
VRVLVSNNGSMARILWWQWRSVLLYVGFGALAFVVHELFEQRHVKAPAAAASILGAALGIFASFRTSAAYARWWEGRQIWGRLVNVSRLYASQVTAYIADATVRRTLLLRHVLYVHILRCQLREDDPFADPHVERARALLGVDDAWVARARQQSSLLHFLVDESFGTVARLELPPVRMVSFEQTFGAILDAQGGCERIKRTPMPRGYGLFVSWLLKIFSLVFPFTIVDSVGWVAMPLNLIVCIGFTLISETGRILEDPFNHFFNSLPVTNLSINIERNLRQRLGDDDIPAATVPDDKGVLW